MGGWEIRISDCGCVAELWVSEGAGPPDSSLEPVASRESERAAGVWLVTTNGVASVKLVLYGSTFLHAVRDS